MFILQFPQELSGKLALNVHKIKEDLLWGRKVNSSVNEEI